MTNCSLHPWNNTNCIHFYGVFWVWQDRKNIRRSIEMYSIPNSELENFAATFVLRWCRVRLVWILLNHSLDCIPYSAGLCPSFSHGEKHSSTRKWFCTRLNPPFAWSARGPNTTPREHECSCKIFKFRIWDWVHFNGTLGIFFYPVTLRTPHKNEWSLCVSRVKWTIFHRELTEAWAIN